MRPKDLHELDGLDPVDRTLVRLLRADARTPNSRLAERAGIAPSTCVSRVRSLVDRGIITGFTVELDPAALGLTLQALISVNIRVGQRQAISRFAEEVRALPEVVQLFFLGGSEDFIVHVAVRDSNDVRDFVVSNLSAHPAVASTRTSLVFDHHRKGPAVPD
ncbi:MULTISPECIES: Lrp/AsnC family transcriptional regulator [unclassified Rathayibacter]|uniref:Lrp/AsnC family transcriptional regulator n=1 Tax=unclassified Rathayibacter TaxID=2609250 RepID=UPI00188A191E|nr:MULTISPECIES: Lrp/AsnC family transcriptional regulator [unclassified Rathayibacter]MBF4462563.1 Lrp/AsnC family transcriptional regulator [Rathayibacter sp. VKM Ac-2879]MBF4503394.1 Lrp/AsnC family transcriptional regulator [Rathayibacter sp. VKM Ac-2878]